MAGGEIEKVVSTTLDVDGKTAGLMDRWDEGRGILVLRGLEAGPGIIIQSIDPDDNSLTPQRRIRISTTAESGIGEKNTASNIGTGVGLFASKVGVDFKFKSLVAGNGINLTPGPNSVTIESLGITGASNIGSGLGIFAQKSGHTLEFRNIVGSDKVSVTQRDGDIVIDTTAEQNNGHNLGSAGVGRAEVFAGKNGTNLDFKRIVAGQNITVTQDTETITVSASVGEINVGGNLSGNGVSIYRDKTGPVLNFRTLIAGENVTLTEGLSSITVDVTSDITEVTTLGNGIALHEGVSSRHLQLKSIKAGNNVQLSNIGGEITIEVVNVGEVNTAIPLGTSTDGASIVGEKDGTKLTFKRIHAGENIRIDNSEPNFVTISSVAAGMLELSDDTTPILGGDLDVGGNAIISSHNADIHISPNGSGHIILDGIAWPNSDGQAGQVLATDGAGYGYWTTITGGSGGSGGSGEVNHGTSIGNGIAVYNGMSGTNIGIRSLSSLSSKLSISNNSGTIEFNIEEAGFDRNLIGGGPLSLVHGGLGVDVSTNPQGARTNLGLGTVATQNANAVSIAGSFSGSVAATSLTVGTMHFPSTDGTTGQILSTNGTGTLRWIDAPTGSGVTSLATLSDVDASTVSIGDALVWDGNSKWVAKPVSTGGSGSTKFADLSDVASLSGANNKIVVINSTATGLSYTTLASLGVSAVGLSGSYNDLMNKPTLSSVATSGSYNDLTNKPTIPTLPTLALVATSGNYNDLSNKPTIPTLPTLAAVATSGSYTDLTNKPTFATVATSGSYNDLTNKPTIPTLPTLATVATSGSYNDLTNKPTIPTLPTLASVATSGNYNDLSNKPTIDSLTSAPTAANTYLQWTGTQYIWSGVSGGSSSSNVGTYEVQWTYTTVGSTQTPGSFVTPAGWSASFDSGTSQIIITPPAGKTLISGTYWGQTAVNGTRFSMRSPAATSKLEQDGSTIYITTATSPTNFGASNNCTVKLKLIME